MNNFYYSNVWGGLDTGESGLPENYLPSSSCGTWQANGPGGKTPGKPGLPIAMGKKQGNNWIKTSNVKTYWSRKQDEGCNKKTVNGQDTNPAPPRNGGVIIIKVSDLPWLL